MLSAGAQWLPLEHQHDRRGASASPAPWLPVALECVVTLQCLKLCSEQTAVCAWVCFCTNTTEGEGRGRTPPSEGGVSRATDALLCPATEDPEPWRGTESIRSPVCPRSPFCLERFETCKRILIWSYLFNFCSLYIGFSFRNGLKSLAKVLKRKHARIHLKRMKKIRSLCEAAGEIKGTQPGEPVVEGGWQVCGRVDNPSARASGWEQQLPLIPWAS